MTPDFLNYAWFGRSVQRIVMVGLVPFVGVTLLVACDVPLPALPAEDPTPPGVSSATTSRMAATLVTAAALPTPIPAPAAATATFAPEPTVPPAATQAPIPTPTPSATPTSTASPIPAVEASSLFDGILAQIAALDRELANKVAEYSWIVDGEAAGEWIPLAQIRSLAKVDVEAARLLTDHQWMADSVTKSERNGISYLIQIAEFDPHLARLVLRQPFVEPPFRHRDALGLMGLAEMTIDSPDVAATLAAQPWFEDGVDDLEAALLSVFGFRIDGGFRRALIETHFISTVTVDLPLTGSVDFVAIRHTPFPADDSTFAAMEEGVRIIEDFMGTPFPINDFIVLVVDPDIWGGRPDGSLVGGHEPGFYAVHILLKDGRVFSGGEHRYPQAIYRQLARIHLYMDGPRWVKEGAAEFLSAYTMDRAGGERIEQRLVHLHSAADSSSCKDNIERHLDDYTFGNCDYLLGEIFLHAMNTVLGKEGVGSALNDLHTLVFEYRSSPHNFVYQTFEKHTPPGRVDDFKAAYQRYYGEPASTLRSDISPERVSALAALYEATRGSGWMKSDNWLSDTPLGEWYGVITAAGGQITALALGYNELAGELPAELGSLTNLIKLDLSSNELTGSIPPELGSLTNLKELYLGGNRLTGDIPAELGDLASLEELVIGDSRFTGGIPPELGGLDRLEKLYFVAAHLSGEIPPELGRLTRLRELRLEANQLTGEIPSDLGRLTQLQQLELHENQLSGRIPPELGDLTELRILDLSVNQLTGEIPAELGRLPNLRRLFLSGNQLTGCIPQELRSVPRNDFEELGMPFCENES